MNSGVKFLDGAKTEMTVCVMGKWRPPLVYGILNVENQIHIIKFIGANIKNFPNYWVGVYLTLQKSDPNQNTKISMTPIQYV